MKSETLTLTRKSIYSFGFALLFLSIASNLKAADIEKGKQLFATCAACHGQNGEGNVMLKAPQLAGMSEWYGTGQMEKFKSGLRGSHKEDLTGAQMRPMAMILPTPDDVQSVMMYVASLETKAPEITIEGNVENGKTLFQTCVHCHGPEGNGNQEFHAPSMLRLNDWYMLEQLKKFKNKVRGGTLEDVNGAAMQAMTVSLTDEQAMKDVIAYIMTLSHK